MTDSDSGTQAQQPPAPDPLLRSLDRLVGAWNVSGPGIEGQVSFEWLEGGYYLIQHVNLLQDGRKNRGIEVIGYDEASDSLRSHYFGEGEILEYTWEILDDTLTIWYGDKSSPAKFQGKFSPDGNSNSGSWQWPGGGYESNMTRAG